MSILDGLWGKDDYNKRDSENDEAKLRLRKEELDINKNKVHKGDVELSKEIIEEKKSVDVPVTREEVVIERRNLDNEASDSPITDDNESIRIPVNEEKVDINKHTVISGEVSAHKRSIENTEHIDETLKREEAKVNTIGDANVVDSTTNQG